MTRIRIRRIAVLGAGTMGAQIAGYLADQGFRVDLFDLKDNARKAWTVMVKAGSACLRGRNNITPRCIGVDDAVLAEADLVVEAVFEDAAVKEQVNAILEAHARPDCILTTNTSGISINELAAARGPAFRRRYFGLHFFNPLKHLPFAELTPGKETDPELFQAFATYAERTLGKGVVFARDTPNFIGNRIGGYALYAPFRFATPGLNPADIDLVCKTLYGWEPLKTWDIVGLALAKPVAANVYDRAGEDPERQVWEPSCDWIEKLIAQGLTGRGSKSKSGFFARGEKKQKLMFDFGSGSYVPAIAGDFPSLKAAVEKPFPDNLRTLLAGDDEAAAFARKLFFSQAAYSLALVGEICGEPTDIDQALSWGFNWPRGIFQLAEACGLAAVVAGVEAIGKGDLLPAWFRELAAKGGHLYESSTCYRVGSNSMAPLPRVEGGIYPEDLLKDPARVIYRNDDLAVVDLGSSRAPVCLAVSTSRGFAAGPGTLQGLHKALDWAEANDGAVIVGHTGKNFCPGANLRWMLEQSEAGNAKAIERFIVEGQELTQRLTYSPALTVAVPHGFTLGGGSELALGCKLRVVNATVSWGQPEINPGVIPAWGGCMRLLRTMMKGLPSYYLWGEAWTREVAGDQIDPVWRLIAWAETSRDGYHAQEMGFADKRDTIVPAQGLGQPFVLSRALRIAEGTLHAGFSVPEPFLFNLPGKALLCRFRMVCEQGVLGGQFPAHNGKVATAVADVLCGGGTRLGEPVTEQRLLDLEREHFMELVMTPEAQKAMRRVLKL